MTKQSTEPPSRPHRLLVYDRLFRQLRGPTLWLTLLCGSLAAFANQLPALTDVPFVQPALAAIAGISAVLYLYGWIGPRLAYVQCFPTYLRLSTPLFRLAISYSRIRTTRPVKFSPPPQKWSQERLITPLRGQTAVGLELVAYPLPEKQLRLWLSPFLFSNELQGFVCVTADWMALSQDIDTYRGRWKALQAEKRAAQNAARTSQNSRGLFN